MFLNCALKCVDCLLVTVTKCCMFASSFDTATYSFSSFFVSATSSFLKSVHMFDYWLGTLKKSVACLTVGCIR